MKKHKQSIESSLSSR